MSNLISKREQRAEEAFNSFYKIYETFIDEKDTPINDFFVHNENYKHFLQLYPFRYSPNSVGLIIVSKKGACPLIIKGGKCNGRQSAMGKSLVHLKRNLSKLIKLLASNVEDLKWRLVRDKVYQIYKDFKINPILRNPSMCECEVCCESQPIDEVGNYRICFSCFEEAQSNREVECDFCGVSLPINEMCYEKNWTDEAHDVYICPSCYKPFS